MKMAKTGFEAKKRVPKIEGAVWAAEAPKRGGKTPIH